MSIASSPHVSGCCFGSVLEGYWDTIVQMLVNALIYGAAAALFIDAFRFILSARSWALFALFSTLVFALPWTWGTTLDGFNVQYYFLELFGIAAIIAIVGARAFAPRWWLAVLLLLCGYLSLAGGATVAIAAFAICLVQTVTAARRGIRELTGLAALAVARGGHADRTFPGSPTTISTRRTPLGNFFWPAWRNPQLAGGHRA